MDHRSFLAELSADQRRALCDQSDGPALRHMALHLGLVVGLSVWIATGQPLWWLAILPQGILLVFLFTALHELIHRTAFATDRLNDGFAAFCAFVVLLPPRLFRYFHMAHHRFTHDPENDPELRSEKPSDLRSYLIYLSGITDWKWRISTLLRNASAESDAAYVPPRGKKAVLREARIYLAGYAILLAVSVAADSALLFWIWLLPLLIGNPFLRGYLLAEHSRCPHVADMFQNTRTTLTNRIVRWLAWNMPYHAEHHAYPAVPFHRLPELHAICREHLGAKQDGYVAFHAEYAADAARKKIAPTAPAT